MTYGFGFQRPCFAPGRSGGGARFHNRNQAVPISAHMDMMSAKSVGATAAYGDRLKKGLAVATWSA